MWKSIPGFEGYYSVSSEGQIMRHKKNNANEHILNQAITHRGYYRVMLSKDSKRKWFSVQGLVMLTFVGPRQPKMQIEHINHDKSNNSLSNLRYCTQKENMGRSAADKKTSHGEGHRAAKLTDDIVRTIRCSVDKKSTELAEIYGVHPQTIRVIKAGKTWKHIER